MLENNIKKIELTTKDINECMPDIINAFVDFYGEDRRKEITHKLNQVLILKIINATDLGYNIDQIFENLFIEMFNVSEEEIIFGFEINGLFNYLETEDEYDGKNIENKILKAIDNSLNNSNELLEGYRSGKYPKLNEFVSKYKEIYNRLEPYIIEQEKTENAIIDIENRYKYKVIEEFKDLIPKEALDDEYHPLRLCYFGSSFSSFSTNPVFDDENEIKLNDPDTPSYIVDSIKEDRISFFKAFGFEDKSLNKLTYEDYLKIPGINDLIKQLRIDCERISKRKKELYNELIVETVEVQEDYKRNRKLIDERNLVNKDDPLGPIVYQSNISCYEENYTYDGKNYILSPIIIINGGSENLDYTLIHELNHAFEQHTVGVNKKGCRSFCGWEYTEGRFKDKRNDKILNYTGITRGYELINEYINESISRNITQLMYKKGKTVFGIEKYTPPSYNYVGFLLKDFYNDFFDIIIKSRTHGNIRYLLDQVGKDNFDELNSIVNDYYNEYGLNLGVAIRVLDELNSPSGIKDDYLKSLVDRRDFVLYKMKEYNKIINNQKDSQL